MQSSLTPKPLFPNPVGTSAKARAYAFEGNFWVRKSAKLGSAIDAANKPAITRSKLPAMNCYY